MSRGHEDVEPGVREWLGDVLTLMREADAVPGDGSEPEPESHREEAQP